MSIPFHNCWSESVARAPPAGRPKSQWEQATPLELKEGRPKHESSSHAMLSANTMSSQRKQESPHRNHQHLLPTGESFRKRKCSSSSEDFGEQAANCTSGPAALHAPNTASITINFEKFDKTVAATTEVGLPITETLSKCRGPHPSDVP
ncbi:hypothetical protein MRX96_030482 [Rhipicephalus microplus]